MFFFHTPLMSEVNNRGTFNTTLILVHLSAPVGQMLPNNRRELKLLYLKPDSSFSHLSHFDHRGSSFMFIAFHLDFAMHFFLSCPQCSARADLFDEMLPSQSNKICCQSSTGFRKTNGTISSWQWNNAALFVFCFDISLFVASHGLPTAPTVVL